MRPPRPSPRELRGLRVGRLFGVDITVHWSWVVSLVLLSAFAEAFVVEDVFGGATREIQLVLSVLFALPLAGCILAHELAHCVVARAYGLPVRRITLFAFGGVSQIGSEARSPSMEFSIALAGPMTSLVLATTLGGVARVLNPDVPGLVGAWGAFSFVNLMLALFNLLPAFPMDGGRILRSVLWALTTRTRATRLASIAGRIFAVGLMTVGVLTSVSVLSGSGFNGGYVVLMGLFLFYAAGAAGRSGGGDDP